MNGCLDRGYSHTAYSIGSLAVGGLEANVSLVVDGEHIEGLQAWCELPDKASKDTAPSCTRG
jgi:hypothetical protein